MKRSLVPTLCLFAMWSAAYADQPVDQITFPPPPRLATTADAMAAMRAPGIEKLRNSDVVIRADAILAAGLVVPDGYGEWIFYYANPKTGTRLTAVSPTEHKDPKTGEIFTDQRTVAAYREILHNQLNTKAVQVAWAYAYTGDDKYAAAVRDALLRLAADYKTYPGRRDRWGRTGWLAPLGGRRYTQSLSEAVGIIPLCEAYDLVRTSEAWTDEQRQRVEDDFFRATAKSLLRFNQGINNHQTWYNAGLMAIANVLGDEQMVRKVITMRGGFDHQLADSVGDDGLWYEGAMAYHFYALDAMRYIVEFGKRIGLRLHERPRFRLMLDGPLKAAYPNGQFPAINDSDRTFVSNYAKFYNWAKQLYDDFDATIETRSVNMETSGLAILRAGEGAAAVCAMIDYGPHGGGHGHFDKLQLLLYANGREWLLDPGRLTYSHPEYHTWVKHTAAHNTVAINGKSQSPTVGRLRWFQSDASLSACDVESLSAYPNVSLRRRVALTPSMLVDVVTVDAKRRVTIDLFAHGVADRLEAEDSTPGPGTLGDGDGYQHLQNVMLHRALPLGRWDYIVEADGTTQRLRAFIAGDPAAEVFTAMGIGYTIDRRNPVLVRRCDAEHARFVTVYDLSGGGTIKSIEVAPAPAGEQVVDVLRDDGRYRVRFGAAGASIELVAAAKPAGRTGSSNVLRSEGK